jgi:hypothetical protein
VTNDEKRIKIAEMCGWKWYRRPATGPWADKPHRSLYHPGIVPEYTATLQVADMTERQCNESFVFREGMVPDYYEGKDSILDAVKSCAIGPDLRVKFINTLRSIVGRRMPKNKVGSAIVSDVDLIVAECWEFCEAFGLTLNLWEKDAK